MNIDTLLHDTFVDHEHLAPNADDVLEVVRRRTATRRPALARPLAIAAGVAVAASVAAGAVALSRHHAPSGPSRAAASRPQSQPGGQSGPGIDALTMPFDLGWLPPGTVDYLARRINVGGPSDTSPPVFDGEYLMTVTTDTGVLDVDVQQMPGDLGNAAFKSGAGASITVDGRDGVESVNAGGPGGYEVYFTDAAGGLMYVNVSPPNGGTADAADLTAIGRRVAENVRFPGTATVDPTFGVGDLPAGLVVRAFDVEGGDSDLPTANGITGPTTSYELGDGASREFAAMISTSAGPASGIPGRPVQGHPTRTTDESGYRTVFVLDAVDGDAVQVSGPLSLSELYVIADGLVLPE